jgi:hypothetical protein
MPLTADERARIKAEDARQIRVEEARQRIEEHEEAAKRRHTVTIRISGPMSDWIKRQAASRAIAKGAKHAEGKLRGANSSDLVREIIFEAMLSDVDQWMA